MSNIRNTIKVGVAQLSLLVGLVLFVALSSLIPSVKADDLAELHIGYQKGDFFQVLKANKTFDTLFPNTKITWYDFPAGPQLLEALNAGSIDIGGTGETPPVFAQAAGTPLVYVATQLGSGAGQAVIVPADSPIKTGADLKGKKIALQKASSAHLLLVRALEASGLSYGDVTPEFLAPADARAAFEGGSVDAWVIWDPFLSSAEKDLNARVLVDGVNLAATRSFIEASQTFATQHPDVVEVLVNQLIEVAKWAKANPDAYAAALAKETGVEEDIWKKSIDQDAREVTFIDETTISDQQKVADLWFTVGLIPEKLNIRDVVWQPEDLKAQLSATPEATVEATTEATASP